MSIEKTLVLVKPDGVARGLVGEVIARIEAKGYTIVSLRMLQADRALLEKHYAEHQGKPFFEPLVEFMMSGPIVALVAEGNRVIEGFRSLAGVTDPTVAASQTFATSSRRTRLDLDSREMDQHEASLQSSCSVLDSNIGCGNSRSKLSADKA